MNKKFSTFFATIALLFSAVFASNAQTANISLNTKELGYLYQIAVGTGVSNTQVLALDDDGIIRIADATSNVTLAADGLTLAHTMWCVDISAEDQGQNAVYSFLNKATGQYLSITMQDFLGTTNFNTVLGNALPVGTEAGGEIFRWKFSDDYGNKPLLTGKPLYAFYDRSYSIGFHINAAGEVHFVKQASVADIETSNTLGDVISGQVTYTNFTLQTVQTVRYLTEQQFNSVIGNQLVTEGVSLVFDEEMTVNPFAGKKVFAEDAATFVPYGTLTGTSNNAYLYVRSEDGLYLMVDTANYNKPTETRYLRYKWVDLSGRVTAAGAADEVDYLDNYDPYRSHYMFRFEYEPTPNNLKIEVAGLIYVNTTLDSKGNDIFEFWPTGATQAATITAINNYLATNTDVSFPNSYSVYDIEVYVYKQSYDGGSQLTAASIDLLASQKDQNVTIGFAGFDGCTPANNKTSLDEDLYVIKNAEGKYLAVHLTQTDKNNPSTMRYAEWVTLERNMEPWNMPAYQWVVEKTQAASELASTSPIRITNREYGITILRTQLYTDGKTMLVGSEITSANFEKDPSNIKADPYVGYRMLDKDSLLVTAYKFRYLHQYNDEKYLGIGGIENDSVLYAETKAQFSLDTVASKYIQPDYRTAAGYERMSYGYVPTNANGTVKNGWATLQRRSYLIMAKGTADTTYVVRDAEDRYAVSSKIQYIASGVNQGDIDYSTAYRNVPVRFYLKENNYKDGRHYYALIDLTTDDRSFLSGGSTFDSRKAAIDDNSTIAKSFGLSEVRTSAFAVEIDDAPLYRRFAHDPAEGAYANGDGPDTMRFYEKYRKEYLQMESNPNFTVAGIDFLGIDAKAKAQGGIAFHVDSAWIGRGLGYIKPQYLISIDRNDLPASPAIACPLEDHGVDPETGIPYDKWTCPHATPATPGFNRGKYLLNFEHTGYGKDENEYMWRKYYRAGFVDAIHYGDSLYLLRDHYAGLANADIKLSEIIAADSAWRKADNTRGNTSYYIINLTTDRHKYATWSMRYVEPDNTAENNDFLIESMSRNRDYSDAIAPMVGAWLKMQNGCLVLSDRLESVFKNETEGDDALIFNVEYVKDDEIATDDEVIAESSVVVIAGQGTVTVKNAAGKKVAISNILGQTVANTVVTSDNATIAVPAGVVVVAVEGEAAVKAIVK